MPTSPLTIRFTFPTKTNAEVAAVQLCQGKAIQARVEQATAGWHVVAECDYPAWALPHLESGCRAFAVGLGGTFLGSLYDEDCHFTTAA